MASRSVTVTLKIDVSGFAAALKRVARAANAAGRGLRDLREVMVRAARQAAGARNFTGDGQWQSDMCGAWLHDSCPLPGSCDCICHGGSLR